MDQKAVEGAAFRAGLGSVFFALSGWGAWAWGWSFAGLNPSGEPRPPNAVLLGLGYVLLAIAMALLTAFFVGLVIGAGLTKKPAG